MGIPETFYQEMEERMQSAFDRMQALEAGAIANPDENRMVGHYWLRNPKLAPTPEIREAIETTYERIKTFAAEIHEGTIRGVGGTFKNVLLIGIGGSALGPQFVADALGHPQKDKIRLFCFDNTDPDGMDRVLKSIGSSLGETLCVVVSKSGGTKETRNGMLVAKAAFERAGLTFSKHSIAVTQENSELDLLARNDGWLSRFPMWDWVGGRTSQTAAVGLLPARLQGIDTDRLIEGARSADELTRVRDTRRNPAALLALAWFHSGNGRGERNMVVLPYKDRLQLFSKYLQQLVMESLGKGKDLNGKVVHQGLTVFGNKGATDQHSYIQQLRDGMDDFFVSFIEVLEDQEGLPVCVENDFSSGDYLQAFLLGTRRALTEGARQSLRITIPRVTAYQVGFLIALFERSVGIYAAIVGINAYHQPGVQAGKVAASGVLCAKQSIVKAIRNLNGKSISINALSTLVEPELPKDELLSLCEHLSANPHWRIRRNEGGSMSQRAYSSD